MFRNGRSITKDDTCCRYLSGFCVRRSNHSRIGHVWVGQQHRFQLGRRNLKHRLRVIDLTTAYCTSGVHKGRHIMITSSTRAPAKKHYTIKLQRHLANVLKIMNVYRALRRKACFVSPCPFPSLQKPTPPRIPHPRPTSHGTLSVFIPSPVFA